MKKEEKRDSEHDSICALLLRAFQAHWRPEFVFCGDLADATVTSISIEDQIVEGHAGARRVIGFVDVAVITNKGCVFIEVKSSREKISFGDVIRQLKTYVAGQSLHHGRAVHAVLVSNQPTSEFAKCLLANEGILFWQLPPASLSTIPSHTT